MISQPCIASAAAGGAPVPVGGQLPRLRLAIAFHEVPAAERDVEVVATDFGLLALFHEVLGIATWLAAGLAFIISFAFTYTIQRVFSFGSQVPHGPALLKYTMLVAVNTIATAVIVAVVDTSVLSWAGGKIIATCVTTVWNYFAYRYWVFAAPRRTTAAAPTARED